MNLRTTLTLLILVVAGGVCFWFSPDVPLWRAGKSAAPEVRDTQTATVLEGLKPDELTRIAIQRGEQSVTLQRGSGGEWTLPGNWPTRRPEVEQLVKVLTHLETRFAPVPLGDNPQETLARHGLEKPAVQVELKAGAKDYVLALGEESNEGQTNRFSTPTYVRLGVGSGDAVQWQPEILRLAPGLIAQLSHPADYYQQRRLFPAERLARAGSSSTAEKVDQLSARTIAVEDKKAPGESYELIRKDEGDTGGWQLEKPVPDRADPDRLHDLLTAVPDVWAEQFVAKPKDLADYGLKEPKQVIRVTTPSGDTRTLLIGKVSQTKTRTTVRPAPPLGMPMPPSREIVHEEYRYAKLDQNDQVFEIKADTLKNIFVKPADLRDPRLARFEPGDVKQVAIQRDGQTIVLTRKDDRWRLEKPFEADAEASKVTELLDRLSQLRAQGEDLIDKGDPKEYGLAKPAATVTLTVEEGKDEAKETRSLTFDLGKHDESTKKLYVQVKPWQRINAIDDGLWTLADRPALAYRGRRVLDLAPDQVAAVEVQRGDEKYDLKKADDAWRLASPVDATADDSKVRELVEDLSRFETPEFINDKPTPEQLDKEYGLAKPALTVTVKLADEKAPARTLLVGKQQGDKPDYFAKLADAPAIFLVTQALHDDIDRNSLTYRPLEQWTLPQANIVRIGIQKQGETPYQLQRDGERWKLTGPFDAAVSTRPVEAMLTELASLKAERFVAHQAKDLAEYGLDQPFLKVTATTGKEPDVKERTLLIGKPTEPGASTRFARVDGSDAVFVLGPQATLAFNRTALDLLDRQLLSLEAQSITKVQTSGKDSLTLERKDNRWQVLAGSLQFPPDDDALANALDVWSNLQAVAHAAYGPKVDWAKYGLEKPASRVTVTSAAPGAKPIEHTLALGDAVPDGGGDRYARLDNGPGAIVLPAGAAVDLGRPYLDYVRRTLFDFSPGDVMSMSRTMAGTELDIVKQDNGWQITKPQADRADSSTLDALVNQLARLRAIRVAAYPAKDLERFGLEKDAAVLTLRLGESGKDGERILRIGKPVEGEGGDRFVQVQGSDVVGVISAKLADLLLAPPLRFRDRTLARFVDTDRIVLERGPRKATFAKVAGTWKLTEPVQAGAEQLDIEDFINSLARLRADELVAEKPKDLKPYGLDRPSVHWQFFLDDKPVLDLEVGAPEKIDGKEGPRSYARLAGGDLVFLLDPKLTHLALAEYRNRTLWPPLDAAQVDRLDYRYASNPFTLQKVGNTWQVIGRPEVKVSSAAVTEALDALAGLKAERTVVDDGADRKLYGLEPPELVLEVSLPQGKRILEIGRPEGESKRRYARVAGGNREDVFIIGANEAERIVRALNGFTGADKPAS